MYSGDEHYSDDITSPLERPTPPSFDPCPTCEGRGGKLESDIQGDGVWATPVTYLDTCPDCLGQDKCPGCLAELTWDDVGEIMCPVCGWMYDDDRFYSDYEPEWGDYGDD